jgi:hypothetical protein
VLPAKVEHLLRLGDAADRRAREHEKSAVRNTVTRRSGPRQRDPADIELRLTPAFRLAPMDFHLV